MDAPELSWRTLGVGAVLGIVFAATSLYAGTKIGFVDGGNIAAALLGYGWFSLLRRRPTTAEGNIVQTVSSSAAAMAITGGLVGPVAALVLAGHDFSLVGVVAWGIAIGVLGCLLAVPLHAAFIEPGALPFPSGIATAEIIMATYERGRSARGHVGLIAIGAVLAVVIVVARSWLGWIPELWTIPIVIGVLPAPAVLLGVGFSPLMLGVGALVGLRTGAALVVGVVVAWVVIAPQLVAAGIAKPTYLGLIDWLLWAGTGLLIGGTLGSVVHAWRDIRKSLGSLRASGGLRMRRADAIAIAVVAVAVIVLGVLVLDLHPLIALLGIGLSIVFCGASARATGETDNTPAGPLGGFTQIVVGSVAPGGIAAPLGAGGIVNGTLAHSGMLLQNWRTGAILKVAPRPQLHAQLVGVVVGAVACAGAFELVRRAYGLGTDTMPALAARSWHATAQIVQHGTSALPPYAPLGASIALIVGIALALVQSRVKSVPSPVAIGIAFILPPYVSITMAIGAVVMHLASRYRRAWVGEYGLSVASGAIAGEALAALVVAALLLAGVTVDR